MAQVNYLENGLIFVKKTTFSAVSSVSIDNCFSASYSQYKLVIDVVGTTSIDIVTKLRAAGVDYGSNNTLQLISANSTTISGIRSTPNNFAPIYSEHNAIHGIEILNPFQTNNTTAFTFRNRSPATNPVIDLYATGTTVTTSFDGLSFIPGSGTITGTIYVYGYINS